MFLDIECSGSSNKYWNNYSVYDDISAMTDSYMGNVRLTKEQIIDEIERNNVERVINYSNKFYRLDGKYRNIIASNATLFNNDYFVTPMIAPKKKINKDVLSSLSYEVLLFLERFNPKETFPDINRKVLKNGAYYGYKRWLSDGTFMLQELPVKHCQSFMKNQGKDIVLLDMSYYLFQFAHLDPLMCESIIETFPEEIRQGYKDIKAGKIEYETIKGRGGYWIMLNPNNTVKFTLDDTDIPYFSSVMPVSIAYDELKDLSTKRYRKALNSVFAMKIPLKKNGDIPVLNTADMQDLTNKANREFSKRTDGVFAIATVGDAEMYNSTTNTASKGEEVLENGKADVYDEAGISQMQFNTNSSEGLKKSIEMDEALMKILVRQEESFLNEIANEFIKRKNKRQSETYRFIVTILDTTCHNYKDLSSKLKEQSQLGFSKLLPQIALGQSQLSVMMTLDFENEVLDLVNKLIPPLMSSTMSGDVLQDKNTIAEQKKSGRPNVEEPVEKTIKNRESKDKGGE